MELHPDTRSETATSEMDGLSTLRDIVLFQREQLAKYAARVSQLEEVLIRRCAASGAATTTMAEATTSSSTHRDELPAAIAESEVPDGAVGGRVVPHGAPLPSDVRQNSFPSTDTTHVRPNAHATMHEPPKDDLLQLPSWAPAYASSAADARDADEAKLEATRTLPPPLSNDDVAFRAAFPSAPSSPHHERDMSITSLKRRSADHASPQSHRGSTGHPTHLVYTPVSSGGGAMRSGGVTRVGPASECPSDTTVDTTELSPAAHYGGDSCISRSKYVSLKSKYFALRAKSEAHVAQWKRAWYHLWRQQVIDRGMWRTIVRMCPEGGVSTRYHSSRPVNRVESDARTDPTGSLAEPTSGATMLTFGDGPRKARVDEYFRRSVSSWAAAVAVVEGQMPLCRCGGSATVVVHGPRGAGRTSMAHDISVAALHSMLSVTHLGPTTGDGSTGRCRVSAVVCDTDDAWALPSCDVPPELMARALHADAAVQPTIMSSVVTPLFHDRRAKFSACHFALFVDVWNASSAAAAGAPPFSRFLVVDLAPTAPDWGGPGDDAAERDVSASAAILAFVQWQRVAFLRSAVMGRRRAPCEEEEEFESSSPVVNVLHGFTKERDACQCVLVAMISPHHAMDRSWESVMFAATVRRLSSRRVSSMVDRVEDVQRAGDDGRSSPTSTHFHRFDDDVVGVLEWDAEV